MTHQPLPRLICFDLDGTLYQDSCIYPRIIDHFFEDTPYQSWAGTVKARMEEVLRGAHALGCGHFVPKQVVASPKEPNALFEVPSIPALLLEHPQPYFDRSAYSYIGDGWTLAMYLARRIGWAGDAFWSRFLRAREDLLNPAYGPHADPVLERGLLSLKSRGARLVLCSNAQQEHGQRLLEHLGLVRCFDEIYFDADKPHSFPARIDGWCSRFQLTPKEMLFVGDQGYYDLYAGRACGARTLLLSPNTVTDAALWDNRLSTLDELKHFLTAL